MGKGIKTGGSAENLKEELTTQDTLIADILETIVGKSNGATATADTIIEGYSAYVGQELVTGTFEPLTGVDFGEITLNARQATITVSHSLGYTPSWVALVPAVVSMYDSHTVWFNINGMAVYSTSASYNVAHSAATNTVTDSNITFGSPDEDATYKSMRYYWFALA